MEGLRGARYFIFEAFRLMWSRQPYFRGIPLDSVEPVEDVFSNTLIDKMSKVLFMHSQAVTPIFRPFLDHYVDIMTHTWRQYLQYIFYVYYQLKEGVVDVHEKLLAIMSVAAYIDTFICNNVNGEFLKHTTYIVWKFFEKELADEFFAGGGWIALEEFLSSHEYLGLHDVVHGRNPEAEAALNPERLGPMLPDFLRSYRPDDILQITIESDEQARLFVDHMLMERPSV